MATLNSAAATAWRIDASPARVTVKRIRSGFTVKRDAVAIGLQHGFARYGVEFDIIAWVDPGTRTRTCAWIFGAHCFNCHCVPLIWLG